MMKPSRFGILTCGNVCAFIVSVALMMPFSASSYAVSAYT
jgi:hypothetical protein